MRELCSVDVSMRHYRGPVKVVQWSHGDRFPELGTSVGVDTETELITDTCLAPKVVVLGVFDPSSGTCYVVYWRDIPEFMRELCAREIEQRYFNLGFDEQVLDNEDEAAPLMTAIDQGRVRDMQIRLHLHEIATLGFIRHTMHSLAGCTLQLENWELDKGDGTESSARLSFRRFNQDGSDYAMTDEQARYLPFDCISTWCLGEAVPPQPTEVAHTKGMVVLAHISANGFPVDAKVFDFMEKKLIAHRDKYRDELLTYGFPDPYRDAQQEAADVRSMLHAQYERLIARAGLQSGMEPDAEGVKPPPSKLNLKYAIMYLYAHEHEPSELELLCKNMKTVMEWKRSGLRKSEQELWNTLCEQHGLASVDAMTKAVAMQAYVMQMLTCVNDQLDTLDIPEYDFAEAVASADDLLDKHPSWCSGEPEIGPRKFFQSHVKDLLEANPGLELDTTEKSGEIKLTLKDMWRLEDRDIHDKFLTSYTSYNHCVKLLSTYMNREYIKSDGRVHPRFTNIMRTGRTSCSRPNVLFWTL